jgi:shikimate dehydrogenase
LRFAVIGSPIGHSKSPLIHQAAFRALGLPHSYERLETADEELQSRVIALREGTFAGLSVTVPHKRNVLRYVDETDVSAEATGAANTLVRTATGRVRAHNTDAPALEEELLSLAAGQVSRTARDDQPSAFFHGGAALVLGTGGAARAAVFALGRLGVSHIHVRARAVGVDAREKASALADVLRKSGSRASLGIDALMPPTSEPNNLVAIIHATTAGMEGEPSGYGVANAVAWGTAPDHCLVYDVVYTPSHTPLLQEASAHGLMHASGTGMLVRQGALAFELWLGIQPPLEIMRAAIE